MADELKNISGNFQWPKEFREPFSKPPLFLRKFESGVKAVRRSDAESSAKLKALCDSLFGFAAIDSSFLSQHCGDQSSARNR